MAVVQTDEDLQGPTYVTVYDENGHGYTPWGSIRIYKGLGDPTNVIGATYGVPAGSLYINRSDGYLYSNTTGAASGWQVVGTQT